MDVATIKKDLENQLGDINKELENIYLPHDAVLIFLGKRTAFEIALELIDSLQQEQPEVDLEKEYQEFCKDNPFPWSSQFVNREYIDELCLSVARHFYELGRKDTIERAESHLESVLLNFLDMNTVKWIIKDFKKAMEDK